MSIRQSTVVPVYIYLFGVCLSVSAWSAHALTYNFKTLDVPKASQGTLAYGINASGQIAGVFNDASGSHGFVYNGQDFAVLDAPDALHGTFAYGINDVGHVVGNYIDANGKHGFVYRNGVYSTLNNPNGFDTNATGINNKGQVVGNFRIGTTGIYGFLYDDSSKAFSLINHPKASSGNTTATSINDYSETGGFMYNTGAHGFLYDGKDYLILDAPKAALAGTLTYGLNNNGQMVGSYVDSKSIVNSFVYDGFNYQVLSFPNAKQTMAVGINLQGQVVGYYTDKTGTHGYVATPQLESRPEAYLAFRHLLPRYKAGDKFNLTLQEQYITRQQAYDLWLAVRFPNGTIKYASADNPDLFSAVPKPFKQAVSVNSVRHAITSFVIPKEAAGHYTLYAIFNAPGADVSTLSSSLRSNIATAELDIL